MDNQNAQKCSTCGGSGSIAIEVSVTVPVCCGCLLNNGECCGDAVAGEEQGFEEAPCPECVFKQEIKE
ncbi:MAG: hypothetical protein QM500_18210 [Methylococcales bacterium]